MFVLMPYVFYCIQVVSSLSSKCSPNVLYVPIHIALYPCVQMVRNCFYQLKFLLARGQERTKLERIARKTDIERASAHLLEVCLESSFQPLLQWYILLPSVLDTLFHFEYLELFTFYSWFLSILSLSWSFTAYNATLKNGALSVETSLLSRIFLFIYNMCLIFARMNCIVVFMYFWGPGQFYPGIVFILLHTVMMSVLHYKFSEISKMPKSRNT